MSFRDFIDSEGRLISGAAFVPDPTGQSRDASAASEPEWNELFQLSEPHEVFFSPPFSKPHPPAPKPPAPVAHWLAAGAGFFVAGPIGAAAGWFLFHPKGKARK